jgi:hypothetical protein
MEEIDAEESVGALVGVQLGIKETEGKLLGLCDRLSEGWDEG